MAVCTVCRVAPLGGKDRFCFQCGIKLRKLKLELPSLLVIDAERAREQVLWVEGRLVNAGQFPDRAHVLTPDVPWIQVFGEADGPAPEDGWELLPGAGTPVRLRVHVPGALPDDSPGPRRITLHARGEQDGDGEDGAQATLQLQKPPRAVVTWTDGADYCVDDGPAEVRGELAVAEPWPAPLEVRSAVPWAEASLVPGEPIRVSAQLRGDALTAELGDARPASVPFLLHMRFPGLEGWWEVTADLSLRWPPLLVVEDTTREPADQGALDWRLPAGRSWRLGLRFANRGGMCLVVRTAAFEPASVPLYPVQRLPQDDAPWILGPGESRVVTVVVNVPAEPLKIEATLSIATSMSAQPEISVPLQIESYHPPEFKGAVGIDFGTTSSCIAVWRPGVDEPETGFLAGGYSLFGSEVHFGDLLSSSIRYHARVGDQLRTWEVGAEVDADSLSAANDFVLYSVKRQLGTEANMPVRFVDQQEGGAFPVIEIAADIVQQLVQDAELRLQQRIRRCALTHPARFSTRVLRDLQATLERRGINIEHFLAEPVAAAIHHVRRRTPTPGEADYHLLVLDLGGGTSDIALLHVVDLLQPETNERIVRPRLLQVTGNRWAGGDDVTWAILELFLTRDDLSDETVATYLPMLKPHEIPQLRERVRAIPRAERRSDPLLGRAFVHAEQAKRDRSLGIAGHTATGGIITNRGELEPILDAFLRESRLLEMATELVRKAELDAPPEILLVGQSWMDPYLRQRVQEAFPGAVVHPDALTPRELKAPVALGAGFAHAVTGEHDYGFQVLTQGLDTLPPARLGTVRIDHALGRMVFHPVVDTDHRAREWHVLPIAAARARRVEIYENSGGSNELQREIGGFRIDNPEIRRIGTVALAEHVPEGTSDEELAAARLKIRFGPEHRVELMLDPLTEPWILP
jgi:hypothetical protein